MGAIMDLSALNVAQLRDLLQQIPAEIKKREVHEKGKVLNELRELARQRGYAIEELLGKEGKVKIASGIKVKIKYRHPQNAELEWTGRGRKPKWVEAWLETGNSLDKLLV